MSYNFYGWKNTTISSINENYPDIHSPRDLYDVLSDIWCANTCAPRMRDAWTIENKTMGQCSITAFLAQDIFGGKVYGIPTDNGSVHCYNVVGDYCFDLASEQFGEQAKELVLARKWRNRYERFCRTCGGISYRGRKTVSAAFCCHA